MKPSPYQKRNIRHALKVFKKSGEEANQVTNLLRDIETMKALPHTWRDLQPGSLQWLRWGQILPEHSKEMMVWAQGPVVWFDTGTELPKQERFILGSGRKFQNATWTEAKNIPALKLFIANLGEFEEKKFTLAYLRHPQLQFAGAINSLLSAFNWNIRCRNKISFEKPA